MGWRADNMGPIRDTDSPCDAPCSDSAMRTSAEILAKIAELRTRHAAIKPNGGNALAARQNITQAIGALQWVLGEEEQL